MYFVGVETAPLTHARTRVFWTRLWELRLLPKIYFRDGGTLFMVDLMFAAHAWTSVDMPHDLKNDTALIQVQAGKLRIHCTTMWATTDFAIGTAVCICEHSRWNQCVLPCLACDIQSLEELIRCFPSHRTECNVRGAHQLYCFVVMSAVLEPFALRPASLCTDDSKLLRAYSSQHRTILQSSVCSNFLGTPRQDVHTPRWGWHISYTCIRMVAPTNLLLYHGAVEHLYTNRWSNTGGFCQYHHLLIQHFFSNVTTGK